MARCRLPDARERGPKIGVSRICSKCGATFEVDAAALRGRPFSRCERCRRPGCARAKAPKIPKTSGLTIAPAKGEPRKRSVPLELVCMSCSATFSHEFAGRVPNQCIECRTNQRSRRVFGPEWDGPRCGCGHLSFVHEGGKGACLNAECDCRRATEPDRSKFAA